jgi:hypothetical protein
MKERNYKRNIRTANNRTNPFRRETTDGEVLHRWLLAGVRKLMPALSFYGYRIHKKTGGKLPLDSYCPIVIHPKLTLPLCFKSDIEIVISSPESFLFTPYGRIVKSTPLGGGQCFAAGGGSVEKR